MALVERDERAEVAPELLFRQHCVAPLTQLGQPQPVGHLALRPDPQRLAAQQLRQLGLVRLVAVGEPHQPRLGGLAVGRRRLGRLHLEQRLADPRRPHPLLEERMGAPVAVLARLRHVGAHGVHQPAGAVGVEAGGGGQPLALLVGLVLELAAVAAQQQLADHHPRRRRAHHPVAARVAVAVRVVAPGHAAGIAVRGGDHHPRHQRLRQGVEQGRPALHLHAVLLDHVGDLVAQQAGQHVVVGLEIEHAAGEEDVAAGQREGVGHRDVDQEEAERKVPVARFLRHPVADLGDAAQLGRVVVGAVDLGRLGGRLEALGEEVRVRDLLAAERVSGDQNAGDDDRAQCQHMNSGGSRKRATP